MRINPEHVVINYVETKEYCIGENIEEYFKSAFCRYQCCQL